MAAGVEGRGRIWEPLWQRLIGVKMREKEEDGVEISGLISVREDVQSQTEMGPQKKS